MVLGRYCEERYRMTGGSFLDLYETFGQYAEVDLDTAELGGTERNWAAPQKTSKARYIQYIQLVR